LTKIILCDLFIDKYRCQWYTVFNWECNALSSNRITPFFPIPFFLSYFLRTPYVCKTGIWRPPARVCLLRTNIRVCHSFARNTNLERDLRRFKYSWTDDPQRTRLEQGSSCKLPEDAESMSNNIRGTNRQVIQGKNGEVLHRQYMYLTPACWDQLYHLAKSEDVSMTEVINNLISTYKGKAANDNNKQKHRSEQ
jgi:hypothetical protein